MTPLGQYYVHQAGEVAEDTATPTSGPSIPSRLSFSEDMASAVFFAVYVRQCDPFYGVCIYIIQYDVCIHMIWYGVCINMISYGVCINMILYGVSINMIPHGVCI